MTNQELVEIADVVAGALLDHGLAPVELHGRMVGPWRNKQRGWVLKAQQKDGPELEIAIREVRPK